KSKLFRLMLIMTNLIILLMHLPPARPISLYLSLRGVKSIQIIPCRLDSVNGEVHLSPLKRNQDIHIIQLKLILDLCLISDQVLHLSNLDFLNRRFCIKMPDLDNRLPQSINQEEE